MEHLLKLENLLNFGLALMLASTLFPKKATEPPAVPSLESVVVSCPLGAHPEPHTKLGHICVQNSAKQSSTELCAKQAPSGPLPQCLSSAD